MRTISDDVLHLETGAFHVSEEADEAAGFNPPDARQLIAANLALPAAARDPYHLSMAYAGLGEDDEAIRWMSAAFQAGAYDAIYFAVEPRMQPLRTRADFRAVLAEHGWPASAIR